MAQTATQLLRKEVSKLGTRSRFYHDVMELIDKAEKIEKEQIINAAADHCYPTCESARIDAEEYYEQTYKTQAE